MSYLSNNKDIPKLKKKKFYPYSIYVIRNKINGKVYVGKTTRKWPKERNSEHIRLAKKGVKTKLYDAMRSYGIENFEFEVIAQCIQDEKILAETEMLLIKQYDSFGPNGYNMTPGGEGNKGYKWTEEQLERVRGKNSKNYGKPVNPKGSKRSDETRRRHSESVTGELHHMWGIPKSEKTKELIAHAHANTYLLCFNDGSFEYVKNLTKWCKEHGYNTSAIYGVINEKYSHHKDIIYAIKIINP
jgi:group I intron endonuclease